MNPSVSQRPLSIAGLSHSKFQYQLDPQTLTQLALEANRGELTANGVLNVLTGKLLGARQRIDSSFATA